MQRFRAWCVVGLALGLLISELAWGAGTSPQYDTMDMKLTVGNLPMVRRAWQWFYRHGRLPSAFTYTAGVMPTDLSPCFPVGQKPPAWFLNGTAIKVTARLYVNPQGQFVRAPGSWFDGHGDYYVASIERFTQTGQTIETHGTCQQARAVIEHQKADVLLFTDNRASPTTTQFDGGPMGLVKATFRMSWRHDDQNGRWTPTW